MDELGFALGALIGLLIATFFALFALVLFMWGGFAFGSAVEEEFGGVIGALIALGVFVYWFSQDGFALIGI